MNINDEGDLWKSKWLFTFPMKVCLSIYFKNREFFSGGNNSEVSLGFKRHIRTDVIHRWGQYEPIRQKSLALTLLSVRLCSVQFPGSPGYSGLCCMPWAEGDVSGLKLLFFKNRWKKIRIKEIYKMTSYLIQHWAGPFTVLQRHKSKNTGVFCDTMAMYPHICPHSVPLSKELRRVRTVPLHMASAWLPLPLKDRGHSSAEL